MNPEREHQLADLILAALERPESEQGAFLQEACADRTLRAEARRCLALESRLDDLFERPAGALIFPAERPVDPASPEAADITTAVELGRPEHEATDTPTHPEPARPSPAAHPNDETRLEDDEAWRQKLGRRRLGLYRIVELLGEGGMGQVYLGEDERLGRQVAVKILPPEMAHRAGRLERFEREARALAALNHPNIVTIHSIEEDEDIRFLTMEWVTGETLKAKIAEGQMPVDEILRIGIDITGALAAAHGRGVIHRDLKPANIMLSEDDRVKILDFGVAKLSSPGPDKLSRDGMVIGTVSYMSPEQLQGQPIDGRSDLFSVGVILFMMATGQHPFPATNQMQRIAAILEEQPPSVLSLRPDLDAGLAKVIERCLAKEADGRPADADGLCQDLIALREARRTEKILQSRPDYPVAQRPPGTSTTEPAAGGRTWIWLAILCVLAVLALAFLRERGVDPAPDPPPEPATTESRAAPRPALAVLPFDNLTDDPGLDWLTDGIAELLVTDLAQSPGIDVLGRQTLRRRLRELGVEPGGAPSPETFRQLSETDAVRVVVRGNYARIGDLLRVACVLEDPRDGQILRSAAFEGEGQASLFRLVDQIGAAVLSAIGAAPPEFGPAALEEVTTSSVRAWQAYTAAQKLYLEQGQAEAAIARLDEALGADPDFALAALAAAKMQQSLGRSAKAQALSEQAMADVERLPLRTRFDVEAGHYGTRWTTLGKAIETYTLGLKIYSDQPGWWNNLARRYAFLERYGDARGAFEQAILHGRGFWGDIYGLANLDAAEGEFQSGYERLLAALEKDPDHWLLRYSVAWHLTEWGRYGEAEERLEALELERPDTLRIPYARWRLAALQSDFETADRAARNLIAIDDSFAQWRGHVALARNALFRGRSVDALGHFDAAIAASSGADRALARSFKAEVLLAIDALEPALEEALGAQSDGQGQWPELAGLALEARAETRRGHLEATGALLDRLREHWRSQQNAIEERQLLRVSAELARHRGDSAEAREILGRAAALLPERGVEFSWHVFPDHVPLLVELGAAELEVGNPEGALAPLARARQLGAERLEHPVAYVRGLYLGALAEDAAGSPDKARALLERFLSFWDGGDLAPGLVNAARQRLGGQRHAQPSTPATAGAVG